MSLVDYCVDTICRHILQYEELPPGLPTELVDRILASLIKVGEGMVMGAGRRWTGGPPAAPPGVCADDANEHWRTVLLVLQHRALVRATLHVLRHSDLTTLDLSSSKDVRDDWLAPLGEKSLTDLNLNHCTAVRRS